MPLLSTGMEWNGEEGTPNFRRTFLNLAHLRTCGKVWLTHVRPVTFVKKRNLMSGVCRPKIAKCLGNIGTLHSLKILLSIARFFPKICSLVAKSL